MLAELDRRHAWLRPFLEAVVLRLIRTSLSAKARLLLATVRTREYSAAPLEYYEYYWSAQSTLRVCRTL